jgi:hypothetical protein
MYALLVWICVYPAILFANSGCCSCCPKSKPTTGEAAVVTVSTIPVMGSISGWIFAMPAVAYNASILTTPATYCVCGYGKAPSEVAYVFLYHYTAPSGSYQLRYPSASTVIVHDYSFCWQATISTPYDMDLPSVVPTDALPDAITITAIDLGKPDGILIGVNGVDTASALSLYGPVYVNED